MALAPDDGVAVERGDRHYASGGAGEEDFLRPVERAEGNIGDRQLDAGLGREFVNSAFNRDYTMVLGTVILYAGLIVLMNLVVDVVQVWLNPKLKFE